MSRKDVSHLYPKTPSESPEGMYVDQLASSVSPEGGLVFTPVQSLLARAESNRCRFDPIIELLEGYHFDQLRKLNEEDVSLARGWREARQLLARDQRPNHERFPQRFWAYYHPGPKGKKELRDGHDYFADIASLICREGVERYAVPFNPEKFGQIKDLPNFLIAPMTQRNPGVKTRPSIRMSLPGSPYRTYKNTLALDGPNGFALYYKYKDANGTERCWLLAITAATITDNDLVITQLQDVTSMPKQLPNGQKNKEYYKSPLVANNLDWKALFVMLWMRVGLEFGVWNIAIQSNANNYYEQVRERKSYDEFAERLGFRPFMRRYRRHHDWAINLADGGEPIANVKQQTDQQSRTGLFNALGNLLTRLGMR